MEKRVNTVALQLRLDAESYPMDHRAPTWTQAAELIERSSGPAGRPTGYLDAMLTGYHSVQIVFDSAQGAKDHLAALKSGAQPEAGNRSDK